MPKNINIRSSEESNHPWLSSYYIDRLASIVHKYWILNLIVIELNRQMNVKTVDITK